MMHMTFYWGKEVTILFNSWRTDSWLSYALSLLACFLAAVFYQYLEDLRRRIAVSKVLSNRPENPQIRAALLDKSATATTAAAAGRSGVKIGQAALFAIGSGLGYMLMLAIMSFNGGVFIAVVLGLTIGYLAFRSSDDEAVVLDNPCACA